MSESAESAESAESGGSGETRLGGFDAAGRTWVMGLFAVGGAVVGLVVPFVAGWVADLPWAPFQGPFRLVAETSAGWLSWGLPLAGLVVGLALALHTVHGTAILHVSDQQIRVEKRGQVVRVIRREQVDGVHRDGSTVVVESAEGRTLFSGELEGDKGEIRDALVRHGYPWESS